MRLSTRMIVACATICWCPLSAAGQDADLGIFLVERSSPGSVTMPDADLSTLALAPAPLIGLRDIQCYDWASHTIWLSEECQSRLKKQFGDRDGEHLRGGGWFVVVAGDQRIYLGTLRSIISSAAATEVPCIWLPFFAWDEPTLAITCSPTAEDPRSDERIRRVLDHGGLLQEAAK